MESKKGVKTKKVTKNTGKQSSDIKAQINNQIIHSQGKFTKAKVDIIRKLVLKLKHPEQKPKQNLAAKSERYENVLNQLKHMSPKRLGVLALIYYKSGKNYLADQNSTVDQLAIGYFTDHKGVSALLDEIISKLKLDKSSDWKKSAKKLFRIKDKTIKPDKSTKTGKSDKKKESFTETDNLEASTTRSKKKKEKENSSNEKVDKNAKNENKKQAVKHSESEESDSSNENEEKINDPPTMVDDFFITADGSNYLSTAVSNKEQDNDLNDDSNPKNVFEKKPKEASFFHKSDKRPVKLGNNRHEGAKRKWPNEIVEPVYAAKETKVDPELHPSWQAKQKLKPTITAFKGTKITFD